MIYIIKSLVASAAILLLSSSSSTYVLAAPAPGESVPHPTPPKVRLTPQLKAALADAPPPRAITYTQAQLSRIAPEVGSKSRLAGSPPNATLLPSGDQTIDRRYIIGSDDRVLWPTTDWPYSAMGRLSMSIGTVCSGSMIGRHLVATARHCIPSEGGIRFSPSYYDGERLGGSNVVAIIYVEEDPEDAFPCWQREDWAIMVLEDAVGDWTGYLGATVIDCEWQKDINMFNHLGYPGDHGLERPYFQDAITVSRCDDCGPGAPLETDTDAQGGQSGGPLWLDEDGPYVYGVLSSGGPDGTGYAAGETFLDAVGWARDEFD